MKKLSRARKSTKISWNVADDLKEMTEQLIERLDLEWLKYGRLFFYRSSGSKARAYARTWGLPRLWQRSLNVEPAYILEVISEHFDKLSERKQIEVILHELSHIPKNFSGSLTPHTRSGHNNFKEKLKLLINQYNSSKCL